jgi:hypothetical protein
MCIDNPGLELLSFQLGAKNRYDEHAEQNPSLIQALRISRKPLNVGGIIRKCDEGIHLNLTQSKYRSFHGYSTGHEAALATATSSCGHLIRAVIQSFVTSSSVPLFG